MKFNSGNPPHTGWWYTERDDGPYSQPMAAWRWWNGKQWSMACHSDNSIAAIVERAQEPTRIGQVRISWSDYWPYNARVPRINHGY